jgi:DNA-binding IclR family transcriptional regulator
MYSNDDDHPPAEDPALVRPYLDDLREHHGETDRPAAEDAGEPETSGVRPYLVTGGRVRPLDATLEIEAQVLTTAAGRVAGRLTVEHRDILNLAQRPISIAEIAARLGMHLGVARVLAGDLIGLGYLSVRRPDAGLHQDAKIIERVIRGLQAIR